MIPARPASGLRAAAALALGLASLAPGLAPGPAAALAHQRLPGDDAGGAGSLPVSVGIGEDGPAPVRDGGPPPVPTAPAGALAESRADAD